MSAYGWSALAPDYLVSNVSVWPPEPGYRVSVLTSAMGAVAGEDPADYIMSALGGLASVAPADGNSEGWYSGAATGHVSVVGVVSWCV